MFGDEGLLMAGKDVLWELSGTFQRTIAYWGL